MSSTSANGFKQAEHNLLTIPGPIEVSDAVLYANAHPSMSHVSPAFAEVFQDCMHRMRRVLYTKDAMPFLIAGSGTLGWDQVAANLVEPGESVLLLNSGYFGDAFTDCLEVYGANVTQLKAPVGDRPGPKELEDALEAAKGTPYKLVVFTHVDTSTGVLADAKGIAATVRRLSPDSLVILDGVCSVASEEIRMDDWGVDVVISASQKGLGAPPGLSVCVASQKAIKVAETRKAKPTSYFANWQRWLPIHRAYDEGKAAYFATPAVNLIYALQASLISILDDPKVSLEQRFKLHNEASQKMKKAVGDLGLKQVPLKPDASANGMTAAYLPDGIEIPQITGPMLKKGVVIAAGLHKDIKTRYIRFGHMGVTACDTSRGDVDKVIKALTEALDEAGYKRPQA